MFILKLVLLFVIIYYYCFIYIYHFLSLPLIYGCILSTAQAAFSTLALSLVAYLGFHFEGGGGVQINL